MLLKAGKRYIVGVLALVMALSLMTVTSFATTVEVLDGQVSVGDSANENTLSGGTVTIKAKGGLFSKKTNTVTVTNHSGSKAQISFDYTASTYSSFTIAGTRVNASGNYSVILDANARLTLSLVSNSGLSDTTATLTLSNFSLTAAADSSNVTINYDSTLGSVTAGGRAVTSGTTQEVSLSDGVALVATANSGTTFLGWIDEADGKVLSSAASYTLKPSANVTVRAVFVGANSAPYFGVGSAAQATQKYGFLNISSFDYHTVSYTYIFDNLTDAAELAKNSTNKYIVLLNSGTLPAGDYTIDSGVTLLIPFDSANTLYQANAQWTDSYLTPTAYRTLTMANGANLIINGTMSLSAKHRYTTATAEGGAPSGNVSFVKMNDGSLITVNDGGKFYAYGFVTGSGEITAKSGATIVENFQIMDFRGGTQSTDMDHEVFPFSQYYVQNIEVPLTLEKGATESCLTTVYMSKAAFQASVAFIASSGAMFNQSNGSITKRYDGSTDRLIVDINGDITMSAVSLDVGGMNIDSTDYDLAINGNITVNMNSGNVEVAQDLVLLPGTVVNVGKDATFKVGSGHNIYVYDADEWGPYCSSKDSYLRTVAYAPSKKYTRKQADLVDAKIVVAGTIDTSAGYGYTTEGGANICGVEGGVAIVNPGTQKVTYQLRQTTSTYDEVPITPAKLLNSDNSYEETARAAETLTYTYIDGFWRYADAAVWYDGAGNEIKRYLTLGQAISAYDGTGYIQMLADTTESTIGDVNKDIYLDLNGQDVTVTELKLKNLYGMDSANNAFGSDGSTVGMISGTVAATREIGGAEVWKYGPHTGKLYVSYQNGTQLSFHRVRFGIDSYTYYTDKNGALIDALTISATYAGDTNAVTVMDDYGLAVNIDGSPINSGYEWDGTVETTDTSRVLKGHATGVLNSTISASAMLKIDGKTITNDSVLEKTMVLDLLKEAAG